MQFSPQNAYIISLGENKQVLEFTTKVLYYL